MKKFVSAALAAFMCSVTLLSTTALPTCAAQGTSVAASVSNGEQTNTLMPVKLTRAVSYVNERMNFTLTSPVLLNKFSSKYPVYAYGQSKKLDVTGFQLMFYDFDEGTWVRPKHGNMGTVANGYFKVSSTKSKTIVGVNVCGCPLYKNRYYKIVLVPVCLNEVGMTYAAPKYYSKPLYYDYISNCIVNSI